MKKIGIIGAMEIEVRMLLSQMKNIVEHKEAGLVFHEGKLEGYDVVIVQSGIGKVNAALCAQRLIIRFNVTHVINTGIAGAVSRELSVLDMVISTDALYYDMDATGFGYKATEIPQMKVSDFIADDNMRKAAKDAFETLKQSDGHKLIEGRIASGDKFVSSRTLKEQIRQTCNPACVEMEGAAIAHACYLSGVPFLIIRCISDMADDGEEATYSFNSETAAEISASLVLAIVKLL